MGSSHIHILIVFVVRILILLASLLVFHLQVGEGEGLTGEEVGYAHINHTDAGEEILLVSGTGLLPLLDEVELHLTTLYGLNHQVLLGQAASHNGEGLACRRGKQLLIYGIIEIETDDGVRTRGQLQLITSQSILRILGIVGIERQCLRYGCTVMLHHHLDLLGIAELLKLIDGSSTGGSRRNLLGEHELHITVCAVPALGVIIGAACHYQGHHCNQEQQECLAISFEFLHYFLLLLNPILLIKTTRLQAPWASLNPAKIGNASPSTFIPI